jgi:hypothetical protein
MSALSSKIPAEPDLLSFLLVFLTLHAHRAVVRLQLFIPRRFIPLFHDDPT